MNRPIRISVVLVVALLGSACTGDSENGTPPAPDAAESTLADDRPAATVSFDTVEGADAYVLDFENESGSVRIEPSECTESRCELTFDRMTAAGATSATVTALSEDGTSEPSEAIDLPEWPDVEQLPDRWPDDEPVELQVTREGGDGDPIVDTEVVEPDGDIEEHVRARATELEAEEGVLDVRVELPVDSLLHENTGKSDGRIPSGWATWQELAWTFDALPVDAGEGVTIAMVDTGVDTEHPALREADLSTANMVDPASDAPHQHGTAVASLLVGQPEGQVPGVVPGATLLAYDFANDGDYHWTDVIFPRQSLASYIDEGIYEAVDAGASVISVSASMGGPCDTLYGCPSDWMRRGIEYAEENGVVVVASAPNDGPGPDYCDHDGHDHLMDQDAWPPLYDSVIAVGSVTAEGARAECSPERDYIEVLAPGDQLRVADLDGYHVGSGTSYAAPLVAGLVAIILAEEPDLSPTQVRDRLADATDEDGKVIPLYVLDELGLLEPGVAANASSLIPDVMMSDGDWPYLGVTLPLAADPDGLSAPDLLSEVLGSPAHGEPESWRGSDDPRDESSEIEHEVPRPECWDRRMRMSVWEEDGAPTVAAVYARENLSLDSGEEVGSGALLAYRVFGHSHLVEMSDGVDIGQTHTELVAAYADADGHSAQRVEFVDDREFELTGADLPVGNGRGGGVTGPDLGTMSGQDDPDINTVLERGAGLDGFHCGLDRVEEVVQTNQPVTAWLGGVTVRTHNETIELDFPDAQRPGSGTTDNDHDAAAVLIEALGTPEDPPDMEEPEMVCREPGIDMVQWGESGPETNEFHAYVDTETGDLVGYRIWDSREVSTTDGVGIGSSVEKLFSVYSADVVTIIDIDQGGGRVEYELDVSPDSDLPGGSLPGPRRGIVDARDAKGEIYVLASGHECGWDLPRGDPSYIPQNCVVVAAQPRLAEHCG